MDAVQLRKAISEATDKLPVGPPPPLEYFSAKSRLRNQRLALSSVIAAIALCGLSAAGYSLLHQSTDSRLSPPVAQVGDASRSQPLSCPSTYRGAYTWDGVGPYDKSPYSLAARFVQRDLGEDVQVVRIDSTNATALLLRADGSARGKITMSFAERMGWYPYTTFSCAGERVRIWE